MSVKFVAEISGNHGRSLDNCLTLIKAAKELKVDRIKLQCFHPELLAKKRAAAHLNDELFSEAVLEAVYRKTYIRAGWWPSIKRELEDYPWSCSVFSAADLEFMEYFRCPVYKIASFEFRDLTLIEAVARKAKPMVLSVNESHKSTDVFNAWDVVSKYTDDITFLYATPYDAFNHVDEYAQVVWLSDTAPKVSHLGLSDHSPSGNTALVRMCQKSWLINMVERHIKLPGVITPDDDFSDTPEQFKRLMLSDKPAPLPRDEDIKDLPMAPWEPE